MKLNLLLRINFYVPIILFFLLILIFISILKQNIFLMNLSKKVVDKMINGDSFSQWLGIQVLEIEEGYCKLQMTI